LAVSGEPADAAGRSIDLTVWLVGLPRDLARSARALLAGGGVTIRNGSPSARAGPGVALIGSPSAPAAEQRQVALAAVAHLAPRRVVALTELRRRSALQRLAATGVHGLVMVEDLDRSLLVTVRAVGAGQVCVPDDLRAVVAPRPLSARERQILATVIMGLSNGEIAQRLYITESTVKSHLASIFDKLGVRSRAEAAELVTDPDEMLGTGIVTISGEVRRD
jgi:DNA-binding NarL/FixJ family response regulator